MKKWKTIKSKTVFKCPYMKIDEDDFEMPSGKRGKYYIWQRPDFVVVIAKNGNDFYIMRQYRYPIKVKAYEFVAGAIDEKETSLQAAKRELEEEAGIKAKKFQNLGWYWASKGCSRQKGNVFLAEGLSFGERKPDEIESEGEIEIIKCKISEVKELIKNGKMNDNDSLAAFSLFMLKCKS